MDKGVLDDLITDLDEGDVIGLEGVCAWRVTCAYPDQTYNLRNLTTRAVLRNEPLWLLRVLYRKLPEQKEVGKE